MTWEEDGRRQGERTEEEAEKIWDEGGVRKRKCDRFRIISWFTYSAS